MGKVLIAEGDRTQRLILELLINDALHLHAESVVDGRQALEKLNSAAGEEIDLVLAGSCTPGISGVELMENVRLQRPEVQFIIISDGDEMVSAAKSLELGATDYIPQPLDIERLKVSICNALKIRKLMQELKRLGTQGKGQHTDISLLKENGHIKSFGEIELDVLKTALRIYQGRITEVSRRLKLGRSTIYRKLEPEQITSNRKQEHILAG